MSDGELLFEMNQLLSYDDDSLVAEIQRVAATFPAGHRMTRREFDKVARASSTTMVKRFGGWQRALERAGLGDRYSGRPVTDKMRKQQGRTLSADEIVAELRRLADGSGALTMEDLKRSDLLSTRVIINRFGTWKAALEAAGLDLSSRGRRWTEDDYFENLLAVWTHYGRAPIYREMNLPPSRISSGGYEAKFATWGRAKQAFVDRVNSDNKVMSQPTPPRIIEPTHSTLVAEDQRAIPIGLRYKVLRRDRFRCVACGRSPANDLRCELHVDHVVPVSRGGTRAEDNLQALCSDCNLGKGAGD